MSDYSKLDLRVSELSNKIYLGRPDKSDDHLMTDRVDFTNKAKSSVVTWYYQNLMNSKDDAAQSTTYPVQDGSFSVIRSCINQEESVKVLEFIKTLIDNRPSSDNHSTKEGD